MNFVEIVLTEKLKDADPALDILGSDRKVLQVGLPDFTNYLKFQWCLIGKEANNFELVEKMERLFKENPPELEEFLTVWVGIWLKKWKERVKLLIGRQNQNKWDKVAKTIANAEALWRNMRHKQVVSEIVVGTLIKNGEICGTEILAENLLKMELGEKVHNNLDEKEQTLTVLNSALRKAERWRKARVH
jgi:hypothetical protein